MPFFDYKLFLATFNSQHFFVLQMLCGHFKLGFFIHQKVRQTKTKTF